MGVTAPHSAGQGGNPQAGQRKKTAARPRHGVGTVTSCFPSNNRTRSGCAVQSRLGPYHRLPCPPLSLRKKTHAPLPRLGRTRLQQCGMAGAERRRGPPRPEGQRPLHRQRGEVHHGARGGAGGVRRGDDEGEELAVRGPQHVGAGRRRGSRGRRCGPWGWRFWLPLPNTKPRGGMILGVLGVVHTINPFVAAKQYLTSC